MDVPEIDGIIYLKSNEDNTDNLEGKFVDCKIVDVNGYDLIAEIETSRVSINNKIVMGESNVRSRSWCGW